MFSTRFWSPGYHDGLDMLFGKLNQGINENNELLALAQARADQEEAHGTKLKSLAASLAPKKTGFGKDDGATMRKAYEGILAQMEDEGRHHSHIADSIQNMVVKPFTTWSAQHKQRIETSRNELRRLVKAYDLELEAVHRAQQRYFNRCRLEEDQDDGSEHGGDAATVSRTASLRDASSVSSAQSHAGTVLGTGTGVGVSTTTTAVAANTNTGRGRVSSTSSTQTAHSGNSGNGVISSGQLNSLGLDGPTTSEELVLAGHHYGADESQKLVRRMLSEIPQQSTRVPILGVYEHTSTGAAIFEWIRDNTEADTTELIEQAGQSLVSYGLLRLIGQVGSRFVNSSVFIYQWRPRAWEFAGLSIATSDRANGAQSLYNDLAKRWTGRTDPAAQSVKELDQKYRKSVAILDNARTDLEATMFEHFSYLERCERERLAAFKAVMLDFAAAVSNIVPALSASVDQMLLHHEIADVDRDLRFLVENYQTGRYNPSVVVYDNYYSSVDGAAVFGLDLDLRARADKRRVPVVVGAALSAMDAAYPPMDNDEARLSVWQAPVYVELRAAQEARQAVNNAAMNPHQIREIFSGLLPLVTVQTLKMYFLELPNSVISGQLYDILKGIYAKFSGDSEEQTQSRLQSLQNTLAQLTLSHIATLDAITAHISRLVTIANAKDADYEQIAKEWGPALCRPKVPSALSLDDVFTVQMFKDLLNSRDQIFSELKRHTVLSPQASVSSSNSALRSISQRSRVSSSKQQHSRLSSASSSTACSPAPTQYPSSYTPSTLSQEQQPPKSGQSSDAEPSSFMDASETL